MQCGSDGQLYMEKEELELENKPEGVGKEKQAPEQKPAMTYAEFKAQKGRKRGKNRGTGMNKDLAVKIAAVCGGVVVLVGAVGGGLYWHESSKYKTCFLPGTIVDGMDVTGKTASEVEDAIMEQLKGYTLTINGREDLSESITGESVGLYAEFDDTLDKAIASQKPMDWGKYRFGKAVNEVNTDALLRYSDDMLNEALEGLSCMDEENMREPEDAKISDYDSATGSYSIIKEDEGTELQEDKVKEAVATAIMSLAESVDLEEQGCYLAPSVTSEDEALKTACETMNKYVGAKITYKFGDKAETLNGNEIHNWLTVNGTSVSVSESKAAEYVKNLASTCNTAYKPKTLKTSYGKTVTITTGNYGWKIDQAKETAALVSLIKNGEQTSREPEYSQKAASHSGNDYGNTYVEINLTAQHLYFYANGKLLVESKGWSTPAGAYSITYKQRNATLKGQGYATPVSYWMPFNGGIGLHDANWRKTFGGTIYKNGGSHGCVNLPPAVAKTIYENISAGDPVLCYHLDGTESSKTSGTKKDGTAETTAATTAVPTTAAPETTAAPATTAAPETTAAGPSVPETTAAPETTPAVTAGGDNESFGPGFVQETEGMTEQEVGPGF